jgi:hypothetical protein
VSWKSSMLAAVVVIVAGVATGALVGGKTRTNTVTATVNSTVTRTVTEKAPEKATSPEKPVSPPEPGSSPGANEVFLSAYLEALPGGTEKLNQNSQSASITLPAPQEELAGKTYPHAIAFGLSSQGQNGGQLTASYQLPTPGFTKLTSKAVGLQTSANSATTYHLTVYKNGNNTPNSTVLYQQDYTGPSTVHSMSIETHGATDLLFVWTHKAAEPEDQSTFIIAEPILTKG